MTVEEFGDVAVRMVALPMVFDRSDEGFAREATRLTAFPLPERRTEWHRWHPERPMPARLPRDLLVRTIAWKLQEQVYGARAAALVNKLYRHAAQLERSGTLDIEREAHIKPGTALIREWRGQTF